MFLELLKSEGEQEVDKRRKRKEQINGIFLFCISLFLRKSREEAEIKTAIFYRVAVFISGRSSKTGNGNHRLSIEGESIEIAILLTIGII